MSATTANNVPVVKKSKLGSLERQRLWSVRGSFAALSVFVVIFLIPPFYMIMTSLKSSAEISAQKGNPWIVQNPTLDNFIHLATDASFQRYFLNSVWVTALVVVLSMTIAILAAFSLSRMGFKGATVLSTGVFLTYLVPPSLLFIPLFQIVGSLGLINNTWVLVLPLAGLACASPSAMAV